jgi:hypothetical protein
VFYYRRTWVKDSREGLAFGRFTKRFASGLHKRRIHLLVSVALT